MIFNTHFYIKFSFFLWNRILSTGKYRKNCTAEQIMANPDSGKRLILHSLLSQIVLLFFWLLLHVFTLPEGCAQLPVVTGIAVILGHMFPFWLQFKGGKGFASLLGLALGLDWRFFIAGVLIVAVILLTIRYIVFATMTCSTLLPFAWCWKSGDLIGALLLAALGVLIISKHIVHLKRIRHGTEIKFGEKKKADQPPADGA